MACRHVLQEMTVDTFIPNDTKILDNGNWDQMVQIAFDANLNSKVYLIFAQDISFILVKLSRFSVSRKDKYHHRSQLFREEHLHKAGP